MIYFIHLWIVCPSMIDQLKHSNMIGTTGGTETAGYPSGVPEEFIPRILVGFVLLDPEFPV
jgi:hypothetical protein